MKGSRFTSSRLRFLLLHSVAALGLTTMAMSSSLITGLVEYWEMNGNYSAGINASHAGTLTTTGTGSAAFVAGKFGDGGGGEGVEGRPHEIPLFIM